MSAMSWFCLWLGGFLLSVGFFSQYMKAKAKADPPPFNGAITLGVLLFSIPWPMTWLVVIGSTVGLQVLRMARRPYP